MLEYFEDKIIRISQVFSWAGTALDMVKIFFLRNYFEQIYQ